MRIQEKERDARMRETQERGRRKVDRERDAGWEKNREEKEKEKERKKKGKKERRKGSGSRPWPVVAGGGRKWPKKVAKAPHPNHN